MSEEKILWLIDDDADDRTLFAHAVKRTERNIRFIPLENCIQAQGLLDDSINSLPDVIFLDINIPETNGWECLEKFKKNERTSSIPVIIHSTSTAANDILRARRNGAISFCNKPEDFQELKKLLILVIDHSTEQLNKVLACGDFKCLRF